MASSGMATGAKAVWAALHTFQYGLAIAGLNGIQAALTCQTPALDKQRWLSDCVAMSEAQFGVVVAIFTLGGLVGSLSSWGVNHKLGAVGTLRCSAAAILLGSLALSVANSVLMMVQARVVIGVGCGLATTTVPLVLASIAPASIKRSLGIMNQLFIVFGILLAQLLAFPLGKRYLWRGVPAIAAGIAVLQLLGSLFVTIEAKLDDETQPLLGEAEPLTIGELFTTTDQRVRRALPLVLISQVAQQLCGVSAVMYFSTSILSSVFPTDAKLVALWVIIMKVPVTIAPAFLIDRLGTRPLLIHPTKVMVVASMLLGLGLNRGTPFLAVAGIVSYVAAFSVGLGPVAWVVLGEVMPPHARTATSSLGLALNWSTNFVVGTAFLPLQLWLAKRVGGQGTVFYLFAASCACAVLGMRYGYRVYERVE